MGSLTNVFFILHSDEPEGLQTFRMGLFGLDKMGNIPETVGVMETALDNVLAECGHVADAKVA